MTLSQIRRLVHSLMRKLGRIIAVLRLKPVANQIVELWNIAVAKKQPKPSPLFCVRKVADAGFRLTTFNALHSYIEDLRTYGGSPDANIIAEKLFPSNKRVDLYEILPGRFSRSRW